MEIRISRSTIRSGYSGPGKEFSSLRSARNEPFAFHFPCVRFTGRSATMLALRRRRSLRKCLRNVSSVVLAFPLPVSSRFRRFQTYVRVPFLIFRAERHESWIEIRGTIAGKIARFGFSLTRRGDLHARERNVRKKRIALKTNKRSVHVALFQFLRELGTIRWTFVTVCSGILEVDTRVYTPARSSAFSGGRPDDHAPAR